MAKVSTPKDATKCNCGINVRQEEMVFDENPFELDTSYLLCPNCKLTLFRIETDRSDNNQKPIVEIIKMGTFNGNIQYASTMTKNRPYLG